MLKSIPQHFKKQLLSWFKVNKRSLPWREIKNPYAIWISEVMLQQTTSKAVIPYYNRFLKRFPDIDALAKGGKQELFSLWAGLGYYKRAENLIQTAKELKKQKTFPTTYKDLLKLPGFGPYTARAVSSLAFEEPEGVVDGNVIRFLSRFHALPFEYWKIKGKNKLQQLSTLWVKDVSSSQMNQALMEMGSLICRNKNPLCLACPVIKNCQAYKKGLQTELPLRKPKKHVELWLWKPEKIKQNTKWGFIKNKTLPFLKGYFVFPGEAQKIQHKNKSHDFIHHIMHYQIFVSVKQRPQSKSKFLQWFTEEQIKKLNPSSLIRKILDHH